MSSGHLALGAVSVKAVHLRAGNNGVRLVQHQGRCLEVVEETISAGIDHVLGRVQHTEAAVPAAVLGVRRRKQVVRTIIVGIGVVQEGVSSVAESAGGNQRVEYGEGVHQVFVLKTQEFPAPLLGEWEAYGGLHGRVRFRVSRGCIGNAEQAETGRVT